MIRQTRLIVGAICAALIAFSITATSAAYRNAAQGPAAEAALPGAQPARNRFPGEKSGAQPNVVHVACTAGHGHMWPQANTQAFNLWALSTLASHPKGSDPKRFKLTPPPPGYSCRLGRFTDHYPA